MIKLNRHDKWYKLDNAAKIFPPTTTTYDPKIFRFSCLLKDEVNQENLQKAVNLTLEDFPIFKSILKKGLFWYYLEETNANSYVKEEKNSPCEKLDTPLLFEVTYFENKINLEVYHVLSDGAGCVTFFENLIYNYLKIEHNLKDNTILTKSSSYEKETDSFSQYYNPQNKIKIEKKENAYQLKGKWYQDGKLRIITGSTSTQKLKDLAHNYNTTITGLLISLVIKSMEDILSMREKRKPISITVPIDLRKYFKSETVRNFFNVTNVNYKFMKNNTPLEEIITEVNQELKNGLSKHAINTNMSKMIWLENFFLIRLIPLFIKNKVMKYTYKLTRKKQTLGLSNVGIIHLPESCKSYVDKFLIMNSTDSLEACIISYEDEICISFSSHFISSEIEKNFFRLLKNYNLEITIYNNEIDGVD